MKVKRKSSKETRKEEPGPGVGKEKTGNKMQVFRKNKASKKHTWRTQEDAISLKQLPSNKIFCNRNKNSAAI